MGEKAFNLLHYSASAVAGLDLGFSCEGGINAVYNKIKQKNITLTYLLGADDIDFKQIQDTFIIYQGTNADRAVTHWPINSIISVTYPELLIQKKVSENA
jgi:NADH-quinone oxidoreductase subunit G